MSLIVPDIPEKLDEVHYKIIGGLPMPQKLGGVTAGVIEERRKGLELLVSNTLVESQLNSIVRAAYSDWAENAINQNLLAETALKLQKVTYRNFTTYENYLEQYRRYTGLVYPTVDIRIVAEMLGPVMENIRRYKEERSIRGQTAKNLENQLRDTLEEHRGKILKPNQSLILTLIAHLQPYKMALEKVNTTELEDREFDTRYVHGVMLDFMEEIGIGRDDVIVRIKELNSDRSVFTPKRMTLSISETKKVLSSKQMQEDLAIMICHHMATAVNGAHSRLKLLQIGLGGYIDWHEGTSRLMWRMLEPMLNGSPPDINDISNIEIDYRYLAAALREGVDGIPRNNEETLRVISNIMLLEQLKKEGVTVKQAREKVNKKKAEREVRRASAGLPASSKGVANNQVYRYTGGYVQVLEHIIRNPQDLELLLKYKIDPTNQNHRQILQAATQIQD